MGKLSTEQQAQLDELTALANAPDAEDDEVWVENADGHKTLLRGKRAAAWLKANGYAPDEGDQAAADADKADGGQADEPEEPTSPPARTAAPAKKATASLAKKATPPAAGAPEDLPADEPPARARPKLF